MRARLNDLIERATQATPPACNSRAAWAAYVPVVERLMAGGFSLTQSVDWLIAENEIPRASHNKAYRSLRQVLERRRRKQLRDSPCCK